MESKKYPPYLFDVDFDALALPPEPEVVEEEPAAPTFSSEELQAARNDAFEAGKAEGIAQSNSGFESQIEQMVTALQGNFATLSSAQRNANETTMRGAVMIASTIVTKLLPEYAKQHGLSEIEAFVKSTLSTLFAEAEVVVRAPESLAEELATRLSPVADAMGLVGKLKVAADPTLGPADCRMEWGNGGAERNGERLLSEIETIVARFLEHGEMPGNEDESTSPINAEPDTVGVAEAATSEAEADNDEIADPKPPETLAEPVITDPEAAAAEDVVEAPLDTSGLEGQQGDADATSQPDGVAEQTVALPHEEHPQPIAAPDAPQPEQAEEQTAPSSPLLPGAIDTAAPEQNT
ncbi:MAG: hypothetical protein GKS00_09845 [Alphaproteobacteria bacterium]|nr:hypothetical protein [Alphaproteobacteria bacterium]